MVSPLDRPRPGTCPAHLRSRQEHHTFEKAAKAYYDAHERSWKNDKHRAQFLSTLKAYAFPKIGRLPVADIDTGLRNRLDRVIRHKPGRD